MARLTADESAQVREALILAGLDAFSARGMNATGVQEIAHAAGVPKGSFYNYFESKERFAVEVIERYVAMILEAWDAQLALRTGTALEALRASFSTLIEMHRATACAQGCILGTLAGEVGPNDDVCREANRVARDRVEARLQGLLAEGQAEGSVRPEPDAAALAELFWNAWSGALLEAKVRRSVEPLERTLATLIDHFLPMRTTT